MLPDRHKRQKKKRSETVVGILILSFVVVVIVALPSVFLTLVAGCRAVSTAWATGVESCASAAFWALETVLKAGIGAHTRLDVAQRYQVMTIRPCEAQDMSGINIFGRYTYCSDSTTFAMRDVAKGIIINIGNGCIRAHPEDPALRLYTNANQHDLCLSLAPAEDDTAHE